MSGIFWWSWWGFWMSCLAFEFYWINIMCGSCNKIFWKKKVWCAILSFWFLCHLFIFIFILAILRIQDLFCSFLLPVARSQVSLFSRSELGIFIGYQGWCQGRQPGMQLGEDLLGSPEEIIKRTSYEVETSFMLMMESVYFWGVSWLRRPN